VSNDALNWAFTTKITGACKAVLVALANHADASGQCWPTIERLVLFSGVSERTVQRSILDLERDGWIAIERSRGGKANRFWLAVGHEKTDTPPERHPATVSPTPPECHRLGGNEQGYTPPQWHPNPATVSGNPATVSLNPATVAPKPLEPSITIKEPKEARAPLVVIPDWMPAEPWNAFIASRKKRRQNPTDEAIRLLILHLGRFRDQGHDVAAILNTSTMNGWTGVFAPRSGGSSLPAKQSGTRAAFARQSFGTMQ